jgi:hypothetical protein
MKNEVVLHRDKEERNILHIKKKEGRLNWIGHVLRTNCCLRVKHVVEGKIEGRSDGKTRKRT